MSAGIDLGGAAGGGGASPTGPFAPSITGATAATRYVGGTASGAPVSGTFLKGDYVTDQTGKIWICTVAGSPGTWVAAGGITYPGLKSGRWVVPTFASHAAIAQGQNAFSAVPLFVGKQSTVDMIGVNVTVAGGAGCVLHLGIYADDGFGFPGALVLDAGSVSGTSTGNRTIAISQVLPAGLYWLACAVRVAGSPTITASGGTPAPYPVSYASLANAMLGGHGGYTDALTGGVDLALPSTWTGTTTNYYLPVVGLRAA